MVDRVPPTPRSLARVRSGRNRQRYAPVLAAHSKLHSLIEQLDRQAIREAIEQAGLVTAAEATLFELFITFQLIEALQNQGWNLQPFRLFSGHVTTRGNHNDGRDIQLWYQHTPRELSAKSRYRQVLAAHSFSHRHDLRPDMVVRWTDQTGDNRRLLIECKLSEVGGVGHAARQALADLLSYRQAFDWALTGSGHPYGMGVAWGAGLHPAASTDIALCTPDALAEAVSQIIG